MLTDRKQEEGLQIPDFTPVSLSFGLENTQAWLGSLGALEQLLPIFAKPRCPLLRNGNENSFTSWEHFEDMT